jgi:hypothetical protein
MGQTNDDQARNESDPPQPEEAVITPDENTSSSLLLLVIGDSSPLDILDEASETAQFSRPAAPQDTSAPDRYSSLLHLTIAIIDEALELLEDANDQTNPASQ